MSTFESLLYGFSVALTPSHLAAAMIGAVMGTLVGVLPALGPTTAMALLLPVSFALEPTSAVIMLAGIYYGAMYGGSTTSILMNLPGESASIVTCIEGYRMAQRGRAGAALAVAAVASFFAGTLGIIAITFAAPVLAKFALSFGPPEFMMLAIVGIAVLVPLMGGSSLGNVFMAFVGLALGTVGLDQMTGVNRFTFGLNELAIGIELVPLAMGLFGISEMLILAERSKFTQTIIKTRFRDLWPTFLEWKQATPAIFRGSAIGLAMGILPGPSSTLSAFTAYAIEKRIAKPDSDFGRGAIEGVAAPEAANNGASSTAFVPLLSLGIPFSPATAILLSALMMHNVQAGPLLITQRPDIFWGVVASMYIGNLMLLILNLPLVGIWTYVLRVPNSYLIPLIAVFSMVGAYSIRGSSFDMVVCLFAGLVGYVLRKIKLDASLLILGFVLGPMLEMAFSQTVLMTQGEIWQIFTRPMILLLIVVGSLPLVVPWAARRIASLSNEQRFEP